jgi:Protein of unknown function (DUF3187)
MSDSAFFRHAWGRSRWSVPTLIPLLVLLSLSAQATDIRPFAVTNQGPLAIPFGLPDSGHWRTVAPQTTTISLSVDLANTYTGAHSAREQLLLDGESWRTTLSVRHGFGDRGEVGMELPCMGIGGGTFDGFIQGWHDTFGLPQGGRNSTPKGELHYRYLRDGTTRLDVTRSSSGLGDLQLTGGWQLLQTERTGMTLRGRIGLPTGDSDQLQGAGAFSGALWLTAGLEQPVSVGRLAVWGSLGGMVREKGDLLHDQQQQLVGYGSCGIGWAPAEVIDFKLQLNGNTPLYTNSDLTKLSGHGSVLTIGGSLHFSPTTSVDIGVSEDIHIGTAADVALHVCLQTQF